MIDEDGHPLGEACFERAINETDVTPEQVVTDNATWYPPALRAVSPNAEHRPSKSVNHGLDRDHGHLKQRLYPMRGCKQAVSADTLAPGHTFIRNLRNGCSTRTMHVPAKLRLAVAWPQLAQAI